MSLKNLSLGVLFGIATLACGAAYGHTTHKNAVPTSVAADYPIPVCPPDVPNCQIP
jgi:hypothetical protein